MGSAAGSETLAWSPIDGSPPKTMMISWPSTNSTSATAVMAMRHSLPLLPPLLPLLLELRLLEELPFLRLLVVILDDDHSSSVPPPLRHTL